MTQALKIADLPALDPTARDVLRVIALHVGEDGAAFVDYGMIAKSLGLKGDGRETVRKAVNRMKAKKVLSVENGKLSINNMLLVD